MSARARRTLAAAAAAVYAAVALWLVLRPVPDAPTAGVKGVVKAAHELGWQGADDSLMEFVCNVALFVPLPLLCATLWPRVTWWRWVLLGCAVSASVELTQLLALPRRSGTWQDLVANSAGALLGGLAVWGWRVLVASRRG